MAASRRAGVGALRAAARAVKHRARRWRRRVVDRGAGVDQLWRKDVGAEVNFWGNFLRTRGDAWPEDFAARTDPDATLGEPLIAGRLDAMAGPRVRILDVGAGPLTSLGKRHPGRELEITAVDPLGDAYDRLLAEASIAPVVRTRALAGEAIAEAFAPGSFDVAYARNALDHSVDPVRIVANMVEVVRPGGFVALRHYQDEAASTGWVQLHQWNFTVRDGHLVIWGRDGEHDVTALLAEVATVEAWIDPDSDKTPWVLAVITKRGG